MFEAVRALGRPAVGQHPTCRGASAACRQATPHPPRNEALLSSTQPRLPFACSHTTATVSLPVPVQSPTTSLSLARP